METQTWLSRHNKFISAENITILSVSSDEYLHASLSSQSSKCGNWLDILEIYTFGGARGVMVIAVGKMDTATRVQILDETDCISHATNTLGKGMDPIILPPAMGK